MPTTSTGDVRIHYALHESAGPPVVLLQGLGLSSRYWFETPRRLSDRALRPYRVVTPDNRGTGRSDKPLGPYRMRDLADDVARVLDHAGIEAAYIVGISLGGMIAQNVALRHPDRVHGLALLATTSGLPHLRWPTPKALFTLLSIPFHARAKSPTDFYRLVLTEKHMARAHELLSEWPAAMREDPFVPHGFFGQFAAVMTHSTGFRLGEIRCPTLVVTGDQDVLVPPGNSRFLAKRIPGAVLRVLPDTGHGIPISDPHVVERSIDELWALVEGKRGAVGSA
jgi:3-oxoadipate enol-lactonase